MSVRFFSLKWKAVVIPSLVLVAVFITTSSMLSSRLEETYQAARQEAGSRYDREINSLLGDSTRRLQELADLLPVMQGIKSALAKEDSLALNEAMEEQWPTLQLTQGVESLQFFSKENRLLGSWGEGLDELLPDDRRQQLLEKSGRLERPIVLVLCAHACFHVVVSPVMGTQDRIGMLVLSRPLASSLLNLQQSTGKEVGLLSRLEGGSSTFAEGPDVLTDWGVKVTALTNLGSRIETLRAVSVFYPDAIHASKRVLPFAHQSTQYEIHLFPLDGSKGESKDYMVIIDDVSQQMNAMHATSRDLRVIEVAGFFAAEVMLLLILIGPSLRLQRLARLLPLLVEHRFHEVSSLLEEPGDRCLVCDEIDQLEENTVKVSQKLQALDNEVRQRGEEMVQRLAEIDMERVLTERMIGNAKVVVLTRDEEGKVASVNRYGAGTEPEEIPELAGKELSRLVSRAVFS